MKRGRLYLVETVQPVPDEMRLEMVVEIEIEILDSHHGNLFKRLI